MVRRIVSGRLWGMLLLLLLLAMGITAAAATRAEMEKKFAEWVRGELWRQARAAGISARTFERALGGVGVQWDLPDLVVAGSDAAGRQSQHQAEFGPPGNYFDERTMQAVAAGGRALARKYASVLSSLETAYGVPGHILLAVWGRESGFGRADIPHNAFQVLATKAFMSTRKALFQRELIAALRMVEAGLAGPAEMKSSWAGALGQPQFLPSSYLAHAVDFDGDRRADIWDSAPDTLASIASYLKHFGWIGGRDWGFEVVVPQSVSCALEGPDRGRRIAEWEAMGIRRISGRPFPPREANAEGYLLMPAGRNGPAFVVTPNFYVLKQYNESDLYALFVGHAGDRIAYGVRPFVGDWRKPDRLLRSQIASLQRALEAEGYDVGGADGLPGFRTRRSIGEWQAKNGRASTCFPDAAMVGDLR